MNYWGKDRRICNKCKEIKSLKEFGTLKHGHDSLCRDCRNAGAREWYSRHKDKILQTKKLKDFVLRKRKGVLTLNQ